MDIPFGIIHNGREDIGTNCTGARSTNVFEFGGRRGRDGTDADRATYREYEIRRRRAPKATGVVRRDRDDLHGRRVVNKKPEERNEIETVDDNVTRRCNTYELRSRVIYARGVFICYWRGRYRIVRYIASRCGERHERTEKNVESWLKDGERKRQKITTRNKRPVSVVQGRGVKPNFRPGPKCRKSSGRTHTDIPSLHRRRPLSVSYCHFETNNGKRLGKFQLVS